MSLSRVLLLSGVATATLSVCAIALRLSGVGIPMHRVLDGSGFLVSGHRVDYVIPYGPFLGPRVGLKSELPLSDLVLYEDDIALGPSNSNPAIIEEDGKGRYLHEGGLRTQRLSFATSDNSDVRSNGRTYSIRYIAVPTQILTWLLALGSFLLLCVAATVYGVGKVGRRIRDALRSPSRRVQWAEHLRLSLPLVLFMTFTVPIVGMWAFDIGIPAHSTLYWGQMGVSGSVTEVRTGAGIWFAARADTSSRPTHSELRLFENGSTLGPAHSNLDDVANLGMGRYFHWGVRPEILYFSSSDGSSPATNEREYRAEYPIYPTALLCMLAIALPAALWLSGTLLSDKSRMATGVLLSGATRRTVDLLSAGVALTVVGALIRSTETAANLLDHLRLLTGSGVAFALGAASGWYLRGQLRRRGTNSFIVVATLALGALLINLITADGASFGIGMLLSLITFSFLRATPGQRALGFVAAARGAFTYRSLLLLSLALSMVVIAPEIVRYWNLSGWMDSATYDKIAWAIAKGDAPAGNSYYMPIYQFGMACVYWMFGHDWRPQQLINLGMAMGTIAILFDLGFRASNSLFVAFAAAMFGAFNSNIHHAVWYTQIENWFIPAFAISLLCIVRYLHTPDRRTVFYLALAAALILNIRLQNAFYSVALMSIVMVPIGVAAWRRIEHALLFSIVFVLIGVAPWSIRNYLVEGRFSPGSAQSAEVLAVTNDERIGFYGLRYGENYSEIVGEWREKIPEPNARYAAQSRFYWERLTGDPSWFVRAVQWRVLAFYGLAPPSAFVSGGPRPFDWSKDLESFFWQTLNVLPLLVASVVAGVVLPWRIWLFLWGLVLSNVAVVAFAGFGEPRLCYPVLLLHALICLMVFCRGRAPPSELPQRLDDCAIYHVHHVRAWGVAAGAVLSVAIATHFAYGRDHMYRVLDASYRSIGSDVQIDQDLPELELSGGRDRLSESLANASIGRRVRATFVTDSSMLPPRYFGTIPGAPDLVRDPESLPFFYGLLADGSGVAVPVRYKDVAASRTIREGALVEAELEIVARGPLSTSGLWFNASRLNVLRSPSS